MDRIADVTLRVTLTLDNWFFFKHSCVMLANSCTSCSQWVTFCLARNVIHTVFCGLVDNWLYTTSLAQWAWLWSVHDMRLRESLDFRVTFHSLASGLFACGLVYSCVVLSYSTDSELLIDIQLCSEGLYQHGDHSAAGFDRHPDWHGEKARMADAFRRLEFLAYVVLSCQEHMPRRRGSETSSST